MQLKRDSGYDSLFRLRINVVGYNFQATALVTATIIVTRQVITLSKVYIHNVVIALSSNTQRDYRPVYTTVSSQISVTIEGIYYCCYVAVSHSCDIAINRNNKREVFGSLIKVRISRQVNITFGNNRFPTHQLVTITTHLNVAAHIDSASKLHFFVSADFEVISHVDGISERDVVIAFKIQVCLSFDWARECY